MAVIPSIDAATADRNLAFLDHLFVVMMENRSFDQMLGYRSLARPGGALDPDVDGLRAFTLDLGKPGRGPAGAPRADADGEQFGDPKAFIPVFHQADTLFDDDPPHSRNATLHGLGEPDTLRGGTLFADRFRRSLAGAQASGMRGVADPATATAVLGYHDERELPIVHHLAEQFCICDRWFSSSAGSTWANRLFLYHGRSGSDDVPLVDNVDKWEFDDRRRARQSDREVRKEAVADLDGREKRQERRQIRQDQRETRKDERKDEDDEELVRREYFDAIKTPSIFDVFEQAQKTWGVYHDGAIP